MPRPSPPCPRRWPRRTARSEEHTSELQSRVDLVCRLLLEKKKDEPDQRILCTAERNRARAHSGGGRLIALRDVFRRVLLGSGGPVLVRAVRLFFFNDTATTEIYTLSLHDALPISRSRPLARASRRLATFAQAMST